MNHSLNYNIGFRSSGFFKKSIIFILSLCIVGFGQPAWSNLLSWLASIIGFALFWWLAYEFPQKKRRCFVAFIWFLGVEAVHLSWMTVKDYQGYYVYFFYVILCLWMAAQFALLIFIFPVQSKNLTWSRLLCIASFWVLMEWGRLFILCGYPFNPIGLSMSGWLYPMQLASLGGIFALSFYVMLTNLVVLKFLKSKKINTFIIGISLIILPIGFGFFYIKYQERKIAYPTQTLRVCLIQTAISPIEKEGLKGWRHMIHPLIQWKDIFKILMKESHLDNLDLIVLPEYAVPFPAYEPVLSLQEVLGLLQQYFPDLNQEILPSLEEPWAYRIKDLDKEKMYVSNAFISQTLANLFNAEVIIGLEDLEELDAAEDRLFTSAFSFKPNSLFPERYDKRILLPIVEYLPFNWMRSIAANYGIQGWFQKGNKPKVFSGKVPIGISICIDEVYGALVRENRLMGAQLLTNVANDVWFPNSKLPEQHFYLGRLRSVENGVFSLRSCNTGISAILDPFGRIYSSLEGKFKNNEWRKDKVICEVPIYSFATLYTFVGDGLIIGSALMITLCYFRFRRPFH